MARKSAPGSTQKGRKTAATAAADESPIQARKTAKGKQPAKTAADVQRMSIPTLSPSPSSQCNPTQSNNQTQRATQPLQGAAAATNQAQKP